MSSSHEWGTSAQHEFSTKTGWTNPSAIDKLAPALVKAQGMIEGALKDSNNPHFKSKYADLSSVWAACKPALQANGLAVLQPLCMAPPGHVGVITVLLHESGQSIGEKSFIPFRDATNPQAAGSAITYARRYALSSLLGICPEDDDGNGATKTVKPQAVTKAEPSKEELVATWQANISSAKTTEEKKKVYMALRSASVPEPEKTSMLTALGKVIKEGK